MSCNNCSIRRRLLIVSLALAYAAVITASTQAAAATTATPHNAALSTTTSSSSSSRPSFHPNNHHNNNYDDKTSTTTKVPTFSCGSHWQSATQCNQLCIDGMDSSCPTGQYCYAGIPCSKSTVVESALRMEMELMDRLIWERDSSSSVKGFVCGVSFQEAESSCSGRGGDHSAAAEVHYCNSGQSSECPSNMQCYASVACSSDNSSASTTSTSLQSIASSSSLTSTQQPKPVTSISFSSPTVNATPILHHKEDDDDNASWFYSMLLFPKYS